MTTDAAFMQKLIHSYREADTHFAEHANEAIMDHFDAKKPSQSKKDPDRLGPKSVFFSRLKTALISEVGPMDVDHKDAQEFNHMEVRDQLKFQALARLHNTHKWVHKLQIVPANIMNLGMTEQAYKQLQANRNRIDTAKLQEEAQEIDGDRIQAKIMPALYDNKAKWQAITAALELATGRRTVELLKTGSFSLGPDDKPDGHYCMFSGQAKAGLETPDSYRIPLLAPFEAVYAAFNRLRELVDCSEQDNIDVNQSYCTSVNNYTKKLTGLSPHGLRQVYALITFELLDGKKPSLIGHIARVLGHRDMKSPTYYQRMKIINLTGLYTGHVEQQTELIATTAPERKRCKIIEQLMMQREPVTLESIRRVDGGTTLVISRVLAYNTAFIKRYNDSLKDD